MSATANKAKYLYVPALLLITGLLAVDAVLAAANHQAASYSKSIKQFSFSTQPNTGSSSPTTPTPSASSGTGTTTSASSVSDTTSNWAGYVSSGGTYTAITGSWKVPNVSSDTSSVSADATWIGIGGNTSNDLIQVGTQNEVDSGQVTPGSFYEQLPNASQTVPGVNVQAGDTITASIKEIASGEWNISITDLTNGESFSNNVAYNSSASSAEWIEEAPSDTTSIIPLDSFGAVTFTNGTTTENGNTVSIAGSQAQAYTMDNTAGQALTATSSLDSTGESFTVSRTTASSDSSFGSYGDVPSGRPRHVPGLGRYPNWGGNGSGYGGSYAPYSSYGYWD